MKLSLSYNHVFLYLFFILIIVMCSYYNSSNYHEGFTPHLRKIYRPYLRNTRIYTEGFYNKTKTNITNLFKRFEII